MADDVFGILRPANPDASKTVIVLGAPRGGTSMVAATLHKLGVMMGEELGHQHEDPSFRREVPLADMIATVTRRNATCHLWGWKLPNSVYYVENLLPHLRNPHFIAVFRNPYSISRSSAERDSRVYQLRLLQVAANHTKMVVDLIERLEAPTALAAFEAAVRKPVEFVRGLADFIGIRADSTLLSRVVEEAINKHIGYLGFQAAAPAPTAIVEEAINKDIGYLGFQAAAPTATASGNDLERTAIPLGAGRPTHLARRNEGRIAGGEIEGERTAVPLGAGRPTPLARRNERLIAGGEIDVERTAVPLGAGRPTPLARRSERRIAGGGEIDGERTAVPPGAGRHRPLLRRNDGRMARSTRIAEKVQGLPTTIQSPFFQELQVRWPEPPTMAEPVSQVCTAGQFAEPCYERIRSLLRMSRHLHRKQWEFVYIYRSLERAGMAAPGRRGLVFGVGREKLPSLLVSIGCEIVATDLPAVEADGHWAGGKQHADSLDKIFRPKLVDRDQFYRNASFRAINMNSIPSDLVHFDFCWSACALEHLGSLRRGLDFIRNSLKCLKPGGLAVHTTEFNLGSDTETLEDGPSVVYRQRDLVEFVEELRGEGHEITLNLHPGTEPMDLMIDRDRNSDIHLRLYARHRVIATSIGLWVKKAG
jgi:hypothetical protein